MRLEQKREEELNKRKGLTGRTIIMVIWFGLSFVIAYFLTEYLVSAGELNIEVLMYNLIGIPRSIPPWGAQFIIMFGIVIVLQIVFWLGFVWFSPEGRRRTGDATMKSRNKDPHDNNFNY